VSVKKLLSEQLNSYYNTKIFINAFFNVLLKLKFRSQKLRSGLLFSPSFRHVEGLTSLIIMRIMEYLIEVIRIIIIV